MDKIRLKELVIEHNVKVHSQEARIYETIHPELFNWYHNQKRQKDIIHILNMLDFRPKIEVLDLGCGTGCLTLEVIKFPNTYIKAVDISKEMLAELERKTPLLYKNRIFLVHREALDFLINNNMQYDLIMVSAFLHHLVDLEEFINKAVNNLKTRGILYIAYEPLKQPIKNKMRFIFHRCVRGLDVFVFNLQMKLLKMEISDSHEKSLADYQTTLGGIDPLKIISYLDNKGNIVEFDKFATRSCGFLAFISDKIIKSQNTFSIIFRKA